MANRTPTKRRRRPATLALYAGDGRSNPEVERLFFSRLRLPNGTYKLTYRRRLDDVNDAMLALLPRDRGLDIMDVAVSSGVSTIEWSDQLLANGIQHRLVAGDVMVEAWLTSWGGTVALLFDNTEREPLLLEVGPVSVPVRSDRWLARKTRPILFPLLRAVAHMGRVASDAEQRRANRARGWAYRQVSLVTPELQLRNEIELIEDDISTPGRFAESFDVIRAANLVQRVYFDDDALRCILRNLRDRLRNGGLLVICRTMPSGINHMSVFRRRGPRLVNVAARNGGVEISELVLALGARE